MMKKKLPPKTPDKQGGESLLVWCRWGHTQRVAFIHTYLEHDDEKETPAKNT